MSLCEALDWCRDNKVTVEFTQYQTKTTFHGKIYNESSLEGMVEAAIAGRFRQLNPPDAKEGGGTGT